MTEEGRVAAGSSRFIRSCVGCLGAASPLPAITVVTLVKQLVGMGGPPEVPHRLAEGSVGELGTAGSTTYGML